MTIAKLTEAQCRRAKCPPGKSKLLLNDGAGLYLRVDAAGNKSWVYRYEVAGKPREAGLGPLHTYNLRESRERARQCRQQRDQGLDPIEERKKQRGAAPATRPGTRTFKEVATEYIRQRSVKWRSLKHARDWENSLRDHVYPKLGNMLVAAIGLPEVLGVLELIWVEKMVTASRVRSRIELVLAYAKTKGWRTGDNPATWSGNLETVLTLANKVEHHAALPFEELPQLFKELLQLGTIGAEALSFLMLCGSRTNEVRGARWGEIDLERKTWLVPGERMKREKHHKVPLPAAAMAILGRMVALRRSDFVFPGPRLSPIGDSTMRKILQQLRPGATVHGMRAGLSDWALECTSASAELRKAMRAHAISEDQTTLAYERSTLFAQRRELAEQWERFLTGQTLATNVNPFRVSVG
jgi:integrase